MLKLSTIKRYVQEGIQKDRTDLIFALQLFMAGDPDLLESAISGDLLSTVWSTCGNPTEIPVYPEIFPSVGRFGLQNHGNNNAKINAQGVVVIPSITFRHPRAVVREYNDAFIRERWVGQDWTSEFYNVAMDVETSGMGVASCGDNDGVVDWKHIPVLDFLFDPNYRAPAKWRWTMARERFSPEDVLEIYDGLVTEDEVNRITTSDMIQNFSSSWSQDARRSIKAVHQYTFFSKKQHFIVLTSNGFNNSAIFLTHTPSGELVRMKNEPDSVPGPNLLGMNNPHATWVDTWLPGVGHPIGKSHDSLRIASVLNYVEQYILDVVQKGRPITSLDQTMIEDPDLINEIKSTRGLKAIDRLLLVNGKLSDAVNRLDAADVPQTVMALRSILKEELNAATGVQDMQRGQALSGERRTRFEVNQFVDQAGVQARHARSRYAKFVEDVVRKTRRMALEVDTKQTLLVLPTYGIVDTTQFPITKFMQADIPVMVDPNGINFKSNEQRRDDALGLWQMLLQPLIQTGVYDPLVVANWVANECGISDPERFLRKVAPIAPGAPATPGLSQ